MYIIINIYIYIYIKPPLYVHIYNAYYLLLLIGGREGGGFHKGVAVVARPHDDEPGVCSIVL
jgi:hypothetical protein